MKMHLRDLELNRYSTVCGWDWYDNVHNHVMTNDVDEVTCASCQRTAAYARKAKSQENEDNNWSAVNAELARAAGECGPLSRCARTGHSDALDHGPGAAS